MIYKENANLLKGEWAISPLEYNEKSCLFCEHYTSYASEFEDDLEPADCGRCSKINGHVSGDYSCGLFTTNKFYTEKRT